MDFWICLQLLEAEQSSFQVCSFERSTCSFNNKSLLPVMVDQVWKVNGQNFFIFGLLELWCLIWYFFYADGWDYFPLVVLTGVTIPITECILERSNFWICWFLVWLWATWSECFFSGKLGFRTSFILFFFFSVFWDAYGAVVSACSILVCRAVFMNQQLLGQGGMELLMVMRMELLMESMELLMKSMEGSRRKPSRFLLIEHCLRCDISNILIKNFCH